MVSDQHRPRGIHQRSESLDALAHICRRVRAGESGVLFLSGKGGTGKTTLLDEARRLASPDVRVAAGCGHAMEADLPYGLASQLFESLGRFGLIDPLPDGPAPSDMRGVVLARARAWLEKEAAEGPMLVVLDDLHWSDPDSLGLVAFLARRLAGLAVGIVGAARPWPPQPLVETLVSEGRAERVDLAPLAPAAVRDLLSDLLDATPSGELVDRACALAGGNPLLVRQLATIAAPEGQLPDIGHLDLGQVRDVLLLSSMATLPDVAVTCAQAASVLGDQFRVTLVAAVAGIPPDEAADGLEVLFRAGLVRETAPGRAAFAQAMVGFAVYEDISPARRAVLHARAFSCLADIGELPLAAHHAVAADLVGDARAISVVRTAADAALAAGAVQQGVDQLRAAVHLAAGVAPGSLYMDLADALMAAGQPTDAAGAYRQALAGTELPAHDRVRGLQLLARALAYGGDLDGSAAVSTEALTLADQAPPTSVAAALVDRVHVVWQLEGPGRALDLLSAFDNLETLAGADPTLESARCFMRFCAGPDDTVLPVLAALVDEEARGEIDIQSSPFDPMLVYMSVARYAERFDEDDRVYDLAYTRATARGVLHALVPLQVSRADNRIRRGRPGEALAILDQAQRNAQVEPIMEEVVALAQAVALAELGRTEEAADRLPGVASTLFMWMVRVSAQSIRGQILLAQGRIDEACDGFLAVEALIRDLGVNAPTAGPQWLGHAMEAYLAGRRLDDVSHLCDWLDARADGLCGQWPRMVAMGGRAALAAAAGDHQRADDLYSQAIALPVPLLLERARVVLRYGEWLRRTNQVLRARPLLAEALAVAEGAGAGNLASRAQAELRVAGGRRRPRGAPSGDLTPQERRVATLAADGLTTREIAERLCLSAKTVESHLTRIYDKLGVRTRRALRGETFGTP